MKIHYAKQLCCIVSLKRKFSPADHITHVSCVMWSAGENFRFKLTLVYIVHITQYTQTYTIMTVLPHQYTVPNANTPITLLLYQCTAILVTSSKITVTLVYRQQRKIMQTVETRLANMDVVNRVWIDWLIFKIVRFENLKISNIKLSIFDDLNVLKYRISICIVYLITLDSTQQLGNSSQTYPKQLSSTVVEPCLYPLTPTMWILPRLLNQLKSSSTSMMISPSL